MEYTYHIYNRQLLRSTVWYQNILWQSSGPDRNNSLICQDGADKNSHTWLWAILLAELFTFHSPPRSLRSALDINLTSISVQRTKLKTYWSRSLRESASVKWNKLPLNIRTYTTVSSFKSQIKTPIILSRAVLSIVFCFLLHVHCILPHYFIFLRTLFTNGTCVIYKNKWFLNDYDVIWYWLQL